MRVGSGVSQQQYTRCGLPIKVLIQMLNNTCTSKFFRFDLIFGMEFWLLEVSWALEVERFQIVWGDLYGEESAVYCERI